MDDHGKTKSQLIQELEMLRTEREELARELHMRAATMRAILNAAYESVFLVDREAGIVDLNDEAVRRFGGGPCNFLGKDGLEKIKRLVALPLFESRMRCINQAFESAKTIRNEDERDGIVFEVTYEPVFDVKGAVQCVLVSACDITERKKLAELQRGLSQTEKLASLGIITATIAHELVQPLSVITLSLDNAIEDVKALEQAKTIVDELRTAMDGTLRIKSELRRIQDFSRKPQHHRLVQVCICDVVKTVFCILSYEATSARVTLRQVGLKQLPTICGTTESLAQLIFILVSNSIQAADGRAERSVVVEGRAAGDDTVELRVSDTCGGIEPGHVENIFELFFTTKGYGRGTGLGLPIAKQIASDMGGTIDLESEFGAGSTFLVRLPIQRLPAVGQ